MQICRDDVFRPNARFLLTPVFRPVVIVCRAVLSRFNGLLRERCFDKPLKRLLLDHTSYAPV